VFFPPKIIKIISETIGNIEIELLFVAENNLALFFRPGHVFFGELKTHFFMMRV
jgi:hypothetical protein